MSPLPSVGTHKGCLDCKISKPISGRRAPDGPLTRSVRFDVLRIVGMVPVVLAPAVRNLKGRTARRAPLGGSMILRRIRTVGALVAAAGAAVMTVGGKCFE